MSVCHNCSGIELGHCKKQGWCNLGDDTGSLELGGGLSQRGGRTPQKRHGVTIAQNKQWKNP